MLYGHTEIMPPKFICDSYGGAYGEAPSGQPASLSALLIMTNWFILTHQASDCRINYIIYNYGFTNLYSDCILPPPQNCAYSYGTWITNSMAWFVTLPCGSVCSIKKMIHTKECLHTSIVHTDIRSTEVTSPGVKLAYYYIRRPYLKIRPLIF